MLTPCTLIVQFGRANGEFVYRVCARYGCPLVSRSRLKEGRFAGCDTPASGATSGAPARRFWLSVVCRYRLATITVMLSGPTPPW